MSEDNYEVGYGKPPREHQFKKGVGGGRKGRRERNLKTDVQELLRERIRIKKGGKIRRVTTQRALVATIVNNALKGDSRATDKIIELARLYSPEDEPEDPVSLNPADREILGAFRSGLPTGDDCAEFDALLASEFAAFSAKTLAHVLPKYNRGPVWFLKALAWNLEEWRQGTGRRLIISIPPGPLVSQFALTALPAYALGCDPRARVLCISNAQLKADHHGRRCRSVLGSPWYKRAFAATRLAQDKWAAGDFMTTSDGYRRSGSSGSSIDDRGADLIIIESPMTAEASSGRQSRAICEWFDDFFCSQLVQNPNANIVMIASRQHQDDLAANLLRRNEGWAEIRFPAIAPAWKIYQLDRSGLLHARPQGDLLLPEYVSAEALKRVEERIGARAFEAQYQQAPLADAGSALIWDWFRYSEETPALDEKARKVHSWYLPPASGVNQEHVLTSWLIQNDTYYLLDIWRGKPSFHELLKALRRQRAVDPPHATLLTDTHEGQAARNAIWTSNPRIDLLCVPRRGDLATRLRIQSVPLEEGLVVLPSDASWLANLKDAIHHFPGSAGDGILESIVQLLEHERMPKAATSISFRSS